MESDLGDETFAFISRWLDDVGEAAPGLTTQHEASTKQQRQQQQHHHHHQLHPAHTFDSQCSSTASSHPGHSKTIASEKSVSMSPGRQQRSRAVLFSVGEQNPSEISRHTHTTCISSRGLRERLRGAQPKVHHVSPESNGTGKPQAVTDLFSGLSASLESLPQPLRMQVEKLEKGIGVAVCDMAEQDAAMWETVRATTAAAREAIRVSSDESVWTTEVVLRLLKVTMTRGEQDLLKVVPIPTISVGPSSLIPTYRGEPVAFKKVDLAIAFSDTESQFGWIYDEAKNRNDDIALCQTEDASFRRLSQFGAVEVKSPDGSYYESSVQLAIWLAAGLEKSRQLTELARINTSQPESGTRDKGASLLPYLGISVVGHVWNLHVAWKSADGTVQIYGPLVIGDTVTTRGTFRIIAALEHLRTWAADTYHPWLMDEILLPLTGQTRSDIAGPSGTGLAQDDDSEKEEEEYELAATGMKRRRKAKGKTTR